jgi:hypothetical protein
MPKGFLSCAVVLALAMCGIAPAMAQFPPPPPLPTSPAETQSAPGAPKGKKASAPPGSSIAGNWSGQLTQIGSQTPYKFELVIGPRGAETSYPDLHCVARSFQKKSVVLAGPEFGCFCTLVAHRPAMKKVADSGQLLAARLKRRSLQSQLLYAHSDPSQFGPT